MEAVEESAHPHKVPIEQLPRQTNGDMNPLGYTQEQLLENEMWLRELQARNPGVPAFIHQTCIDYYRIKGEEAIRKELEDGA